jgi:hypothetical protein
MMTYILYILAALIFTNAVIKLSFWRWWQQALFGLACGAFVVAIYPSAIGQSKTQIAAYLSDRSMMQDMAVLLTVEAVVCLMFCFTAMRALYGAGRSRWKRRLLEAYPCLMLFPALFYVLTELVFSMPGTAFESIAYGWAATVALALPALSRLAALILPEKELRLELHFLFSLMICVLGLLTNN